MLGVSINTVMKVSVAGAEAVGAHKTSMRQDIEAGRSLEIEAVIGAIIELARLTNSDCPAINAVYACASLLDKTTQIK